MLTNLACTISNLRGEWYYTMVQRLHHRQTRSQGTEGWKDASENNKWMIVQCATVSKSLNPRSIDKSVSDIRIRIRFPFESSFWISVSGCKLTILPDIHRQAGSWSSLTDNWFTPLVWRVVNAPRDKKQS